MVCDANFGLWEAVVISLGTGAIGLCVLRSVEGYRSLLTVPIVVILLDLDPVPNCYLLMSLQLSCTCFDQLCQLLWLLPIIQEVTMLLRHPAALLAAFFPLAVFCTSVPVEIPVEISVP